MGLSVTVRVQGHDPDGTAWEEMLATEAVVRHVFVGADRLTRLNLQFPDLAGFDRLLHAAGAPPLPGEVP